MISEQRKAELQARGYSVENMGAEWGAEWEGQYRWINPDIKPDGYGFPVLGEQAAWSCADTFDREYMLWLKK